MPRMNLEKAAAEQRSRDGLGPIYRHLLGRERDQQARYGHLRTVPVCCWMLWRPGRRLRYRLWRVAIELRPPRCGPTLIVTPDM